MYKLVPSLKEREETLKTEFYERRGLKRPADDGLEVSPSNAPRRLASAAGGSTPSMARPKLPASTTTPPSAASGSGGDYQISFFLEPVDTAR